MDDLISRQAAIRWVKTECNPYGKPTLEFESGKKVIEHLKQMPSAQPATSCSEIPNNSDTVSRQEAIDALKHNQDIYSHNFHDDPIDKYTTAIIATDIDTLVKLPSVQPKSGNWIPQKGGGLRCSECGGYALDEPDGNFIHIAVPSNYCPNCGAKMKIRQNG